MICRQNIARREILTAKKKKKIRRQNITWLKILTAKNIDGQKKIECHDLDVDFARSGIAQHYIVQSTSRRDDRRDVRRMGTNYPHYIDQHRNGPIMMLDKAE